MSSSPAVDILTPPSFCRYADGPCDQSFTALARSDALFLFASTPAPIAGTIDEAARLLKERHGGKTWQTWRDLPISGQIILCEICKGTRATTTVFADVTTLNFNLMFEIGLAIGLGLPVVPIRDTNYMVDQRRFNELGLLDTLGYQDFTNADMLRAVAVQNTPGAALPIIPVKTYRETPLFVLKGPIDTEGAVQLMSTLKKSPLRFRTYDQIERPRLSLSFARKQIAGSFGVVANLLSPNRHGATVHNATCALLCGMALAQQKVVVMLQEEHVHQPIDYRDLVQTYEKPRDIMELMEEPIQTVIERLQDVSLGALPTPEGLLEELDLGDIAAENEIRGLRSYFVRTGQYQRALDGHARLVVGRKGTGKTAIFYAVRGRVGQSHDRVVLDLKPEGHQFTKLGEVITRHLAPGQQEHTLTGFWNYMLLAEMARTVLAHDRTLAHRDPDRLRRFEHLEATFLDHRLASADDLSQRLLHQVDRLAERFESAGNITARTDLTELIYGGDIHQLDDALSEYVRGKEAVWLLVDNLDKGWATTGATDAEILILRTLLEATRKLQRQFETRDVDFKCLVFIRTDIYQALFDATRDKGKDTAIRLDWDDADLFKEILRARVAASTGVKDGFDQVWGSIFEPVIHTEDSFRYMVERTLMRPRDLLTFVQRAIETALNRGHEKVTAGDVQQAERSYSEDMLLMTAAEIDDTHPAVGDVMYTFHGGPRSYSYDELDAALADANLGPGDRAEALELMLWFGFLGVKDAPTGEERYSHDVRFNIRQLTSSIEAHDSRFVVHPAFCAALEVPVA